MIRIKICGITSVEDARLAADLGASAIGIVFWPQSARCVTLEQAEEIVGALPPLVSAIGVFVDQVEEAAHAVREIGLSAVQFHGDEAPHTYEAFPVRVIKAIPVSDASARAAAAAVPPPATLLLDAHDPIRRGGTGRTIDWSIAATIARERPVILSGGLTPENVAEAIEAVHPYAIDVSSGVESSPGHKDPAKLRALFDAIDERRRHRTQS